MSCSDCYKESKKAGTYTIKFTDDLDLYIGACEQAREEHNAYADAFKFCSNSSVIIGANKSILLCAAEVERQIADRYTDLYLAISNAEKVKDA